MYKIFLLSPDGMTRTHVGAGQTHNQVTRELQALGLLQMNEKCPRLPRLGYATVAVRPRGQQSYSIECPHHEERVACTYA